MKLKQDLNLLDVFCIATGAMVSSGLFILPGLAYARAGPAVIVSYLLAGLLSLPGMLSIAEMTTAMPRAGGDCFTVVRSLGPSAGTVAGLLSWFSLSMKSAFALVGISIFTALIVDTNLHLLSVIFCAGFVLINLVGVKHAGRTQVGLVIALLVPLLIYIIFGLNKIRVENLAPFAPNGFAPVLFTTGFVFVSYAGLLKIASVAEEIKNPARNIPLGMIISLLVVSLLYGLIVLVTAGVLEPAVLSQSLTPISDGAAVSMGQFGKIALSLAAIFAFLSTANAGIMTAARSLVPLSRDGLLPESLGRINKRFGTPHIALFITGLMIAISLLLKLEILVEAASIVLILTNILSCLSVIILRESRLQNYQPKFRSPLYPWMQIAGIIGFGLLIFEMGIEAHVITFILVVGGLFVYWFYGRIRATREYALLHLIERITAKELTTHSLESELREIIRERDEIIKDRFDHIIEKVTVLDVEQSLQLEEFFSRVADAMSPRLGIGTDELFKLLVEREKQSSTVLRPDLAIPHVVIPGEHTFDILLARCREGIFFSEKEPKVHAVFVIMGTKDERNFHLHALAAIAQIVHDPHFEEKWNGARTKEVLREIILLGERRRSIGERNSSLFT
ncbi:MAG: amino acid permease [Planctomycetota bacterium]|jgi:amino acid transporter/mannitol/fructose-specific phosphotransferase system IIA component (Ntr-type)